ncbi:hypothetical protein RQP46_008023 [Phenoliferia psychrophenolica]
MDSTVPDLRGNGRGPLNAKIVLNGPVEPSVEKVDESPAQAGSQADVEAHGDLPLSDYKKRLSAAADASDDKGFEWVPYGDSNESWMKEKERMSVPETRLEIPPTPPPTTKIPSFLSSFLESAETYKPKGPVREFDLPLEIGFSASQLWCRINKEPAYILLEKRDGSVHVQKYCIEDVRGDRSGELSIALPGLTLLFPESTTWPRTAIIFDNDRHIFQSPHHAVCSYELLYLPPSSYYSPNDGSPGPAIASPEWWARQTCPNNGTWIWELQWKGEKAQAGSRSHPRSARHHIKCRIPSDSPLKALALATQLKK